MLKIFQHTKEEQVTEEEKQIENFDKEIEKLKAEKAPIDQQIATLHAKIFAEKYFPEKKRMQAERGKLTPKRNNLQTKIDNLREEQAHAKLIKLMKENSQHIKVQINGSDVQIDKNLDVKVVFSCGHSIKVPIFEILRIQSTLKTTLQLLSTWDVNVRNGYNISRSLLCEGCMRAKRERIEKDHVYNPQHRTGQANIQIVIFK
jgi:predicted RNase H-like nuclease (RuvC/YqgF family)